MIETPIVLVLGGTGVFDERLVTILLESTDFEVVLAARDAGRLAASVARLGRVSSLVSADASGVTGMAVLGGGLGRCGCLVFWRRGAWRQRL